MATCRYGQAANRILYGKPGCEELIQDCGSDTTRELLIYPQEEKNTAYIPNIDYLNLAKNEVYQSQCRQPGYHLSNLQSGRKYVYLCPDILGYQDTYDHEELGRRKDTRFC